MLDVLPSLSQADARNCRVSNAKAIGYFHRRAPGLAHFSNLANIIFGKFSQIVSFTPAKRADWHGIYLIFARCDPLQIGRCIVGFIKINVVNLRKILGVRQKSRCDEPMNKGFPFNTFDHESVLEISVSSVARPQKGNSPPSIDPSKSAGITDGKIGAINRMGHRPPNLFHYIVVNKAKRAFKGLF